MPLIRWAGPTIKVVVVDDAVAFVGGLDLTHGRWDTSRHLHEEPNRLDAQSQPSCPFHDLQAIVDGPRLARSATSAAIGGGVPPSGNPLLKRRTDDDPWPKGLEPELTDIDVAIARTDPGWVTGPSVEKSAGCGRCSRIRDPVALPRKSIFQFRVVGAALEAVCEPASRPGVGGIAAHGGGLAGGADHGSVRARFTPGSWTPM